MIGSLQDLCVGGCFFIPFNNRCREGGVCFFLHTILCVLWCSLLQYVVSFYTLWRVLTARASSWSVGYRYYVWVEVEILHESYHQNVIFLKDLSLIFFKFQNDSLQILRNVIFLRDLSPDERLQSTAFAPCSSGYNLTKREKLILLF